MAAYRLYVKMTIDEDRLFALIIADLAKDRGRQR